MQAAGSCAQSVTADKRRHQHNPAIRNRVEIRSLAMRWIVNPQGRRDSPTHWQLSVLHHARHPRSQEPGPGTLYRRCFVRISFICKGYSNWPAFAPFMAGVLCTRVFPADCSPKGPSKTPVIDQFVLAPAYHAMTNQARRLARDSCVLSSNYDQNKTACRYTRYREGSRRRG